MVAYLFAIAHGARVLYDTDDDNDLKPFGHANLSESELLLQQEPIDSFSVPAGHVAVGTLSGACDTSGACPDHEPGSLELSCRHSVNPYAHFGQPTLWPRGQPLRCVSALSTAVAYRSSPDARASLRSTAPASAPGGAAFRPAVLQSVVDGDPDVDAVFRLTRRAAGHSIDVRFDSSRPPLLLPPGLVAPWNSQATVQGAAAFFTLVLPAATSFRVTDIWRAFAGQRLLWGVGRGVAFVPPLVHSERNPHDSMSDYRQEQQLYDQSGELIEFLLRWRWKGGAGDCGRGEWPSIGGLPEASRMAVCLARAMVGGGFLERSDAKLVEAFQRDLQLLGYQPPAVVQRGDSGTIGSEDEHGSDPVVEAAKDASSGVVDWFGGAQASISTGLDGPGTVRVSMGVQRGGPNDRFRAVTPLSQQAPAASESTSSASAELPPSSTGSGPVVPVPTAH